MAHVASRMDPSIMANEERDVRVEDYLNDKLQTSTDLANIDALLEDVKAQQILLQRQVCYVPGSVQLRSSDHDLATRSEGNF
jgi:hypothetical protein